MALAEVRHVAVEGQAKAKPLYLDANSALCGLCWGTQSSIAQCLASSLPLVTFPCNMSHLAKLKDRFFEDHKHPWRCTFDAHDWYDNDRNLSDEERPLYDATLQMLGDILANQCPACSKPLAMKMENCAVWQCESCYLVFCPCCGADLALPGKMAVHAANDRSHAHLRECQLNPRVLANGGRRVEGDRGVFLTELEALCASRKRTGVPQKVRFQQNRLLSTRQPAELKALATFWFNNKAELEALDIKFPFDAGAEAAGPAKLPERSLEDVRGTWMETVTLRWLTDLDRENRQGGMWANVSADKRDRTVQCIVQRAVGQFDVARWQNPSDVVARQIALETLMACQFAASEESAFNEELARQTLSSQCLREIDEHSSGADLANAGNMAMTIMYG